MTKRRNNLIKKPKMDLFTLYEKAVMSPEADMDFMINVFKKETGKPPRFFREDFCQTALLACEFAKRNSQNQAWGVDLNGKSLSWAKKYNLATLENRAKNVHLCKENVLSVKTPKMDMICSLNFSYFTFKDRKILKNYFKKTNKDLNKRGLFCLDIMGGPDTQEITEDRARRGNFTYIWDQVYFNPINHHLKCYIHFRLKSGKMIKRAFSYDWRLWSIPEITDMLYDSGYREVRIYWEDEDKKGQGNGVYRHRRKAENTLSWVAYVLAFK